MRQLLLLTAAFILMASVACAQSDSTRFIFGLPVTEDDTAKQFPGRDAEPGNRLTAVQPGALPDKLRSVLNEQDQYKGWQDSTVYLERNTGLYLVPIRYEEGIKLFGLSENGDPVTYNEITIVSPR